jgi:hypothetical protein
MTEYFIFIFLIHCLVLNFFRPIYFSHPSKLNQSHSIAIKIMKSNASFTLFSIFKLEEPSYCYVFIAYLFNLKNIYIFIIKYKIYRLNLSHYIKLKYLYIFINIYQCIF